VRIGLIGPVPGDVPLEALERAADFLLAVVGTSRIVYLGNDDALDRQVLAWATRLVGGDPTDEAAWQRAADVAIAGTPQQIQGFVAAERKRLLLRALVSLPDETLRTRERIGGLTVVMIHRRGDLDQEDVTSAGVVIYGNGPTPHVERVGTLWFVSPGPLAGDSGLAVLDDEDGGLVLRLYDGEGRALSSTVLSGPTSPERSL
jgi:hypothetical protein